MATGTPAWSAPETVSNTSDTSDALNMSSTDGHPGPSALPEGVPIALAGHEPTGRLTVQRGLFTGPVAKVSEGLYLRICRGSAVTRRESVAVRSETEVDTNTYFGRFPASYWQRWTVVDEVAVELVVSGSGRIAVVATDLNGDERVVATEPVNGARAEAITLTAKVDKFIDAGALFVRITTGEAELVVERLRWTVLPPPRLRPTAVVICTYNRVDDCLNTLTALAADPTALDVVDAVYVVDQGSDPVQSRVERFAEVSHALHGRLRYLRQPNLGGAGGFSRGMYEVLGMSADSGSAVPVEDANVLLMDDDVLLEPDLVIRLTAFANRTVQPTLVGGQMLRLFHPDYLFHGAEWADMDEFVPGKVIENAVDDLDLLGVDDRGKRNITRLERRVDADYNAWWSCLIPAEVIQSIGYPLPLFFQWDDIEFGYRARKQGFATVTLPGAGLWHADFDWKDLDEWNRYFSIRNAMICAALHGRLDPMRTARVLLAQIVRNLLAMQYGLTATIIKAAEDFLVGPAILADGGTSTAAEIRKLRAGYPDTVVHPVTAVPGYGPAELPQSQISKEITESALNARATLLKRVASVLLGRSARPMGAVAAKEANWWHVSLFDTVVVTDSSQEGVRLRKRDRGQMVKLFIWGVRVLKRVVTEAPRCREEYRAALPGLTSRENWKRLYGL